jgi:hypothetical protein
MTIKRLKWPGLSKVIFFFLYFLLRLKLGDDMEKQGRKREENTRRKTGKGKKERKVENMKERFFHTCHHKILSCIQN